MKIISHRGNLSGISEAEENNPVQIQKCIDLGYDVEIDLRMKSGTPHLGHDIPQYPVEISWLSSRKKFLWIHVKEYEALVWLMSNIPDATYFCHESDRYTLVSNGYIWSHDIKNKMTKNCVIPLLSRNDLEKFEFRDQRNLGAICTDFVFDAEKIIAAGDLP